VPRINQITKEQARELLGVVLYWMVNDSLPEDLDPEPELRGWIEIGEKPNRKLISTTTDRIYREGSYRHNGSGFQSNPNEIHMLLDGGKDYENLEISFDDFKQLIKGAS
jgi:hypothetical protein